MKLFFKENLLTGYDLFPRSSKWRTETPTGGIAPPHGARRHCLCQTGFTGVPQGCFSQGFQKGAVQRGSAKGFAANVHM